jgi:TRAP-type mannitol/chloroaromatic compound transport system substrate-binding protein
MRAGGLTVKSRISISLALAVVGLVLTAAPPPAAGQAAVTTLKIQAPVPPASSLYEPFKLFAERVDRMSAGKLKVELLPAGAVVPVFESLDAVARGVLDGTHSAASYWIGKHKAAALFGSTPGGPFGMDVVDYIGWMYDGGGLELYRQFYQDVLKRDVVPFPMLSVMPQVLGWFKRPIKSWEDLKGMKCRQVGIASEVYAEAGMRVVNLPGGEVLPAGERGVIDCAEWVGPSEDMKMGFQNVWKYYYMPSMHDPVAVIELLINTTVWKKLPPEFQEIIRSATMEVTFRYQAAFNKYNAIALKELREKHGVNVLRTPDDVHRKILEAWDKISAAEAAKDPFFKKVLESQRTYAGLVVPARRFIYPPYDFAANHYWPEKK